MTLLQNRVAVITGGAQGIGLEVARTFSEHGARVVLGDLHEERLTAAVTTLGGEERARAAVCDVRRADQMEALLALAVDAFGSLDVMVNNAGSPGTPRCGP
jgi:3-oxoacyl-[acyl-carrier protein] reductase